MRDHIKLSPLGFGCAPIMGKVGKTQALRAMECAFDLGVTHFDVARSYGFGRAENVVGKFIKGRRDKITVTSKFGIVPPALSASQKAIIPVARIVARMCPKLNTKLRKKSGQLLVNRNFDINFARKCLDQSLSALSTDYIDIYLVHEPDQDIFKSPEELFGFLDDSVSLGKIRRWGFGFGSITDFEWGGDSGGDVIQFDGNIGTLPLCDQVLDDKRQRIVFRPFMGGLNGVQELQSVVQNLRLNATLEELGASLNDVSLCLSRYIAGKTGSVLCSMFSPKHIHQNVISIDRFSDDPDMKRVIDTIVRSTVGIG